MSFAARPGKPGPQAPPQARLDPAQALPLVLDASVPPLEPPLQLAPGTAAPSPREVSRLKLVRVRLQITAQRVHRVDFKLGELLAPPFLGPGA